MRRPLAAVVIAGAVALGAAQAAPFGASSHRMGGGAAPAEQGRTLSVFEALFALLGFDLAASIEPIAREGVADQAGKADECDRAKKTEVAKAEPKDSEGGSSKGRTRTGEPIYLAF